MANKALRRMKLDGYELDSDTRENFESVEEYINNEPFAKAGWEFAEITIDGVFTSSSPYLFKHSSSSIPMDVIITSTRKIREAASLGTVAVLYDDIDSDFIKFSCTSPGAIVRFFFGNFREQKR